MWEKGRVDQVSVTFPDIIPDRSDFSSVRISMPHVATAYRLWKQIQQAYSRIGPEDLKELEGKLKNCTDSKSYLKIVRDTATSYDLVVKGMFDAEE